MPVEFAPALPAPVSFDTLQFARLLFSLPTEAPETRNRKCDHMHPLLRSSLILLFGALIVPGAAGQSQQRDSAKEDAIINQLRSIAPASVKDFEAGTAAMDSEDYGHAAEFYKKVVDKAPGFDPAMRRLGLSLAFSGRVAEGKTQLGNAIAKNRSPENLISMAEILAYPAKTQGTQEDKLQALQLAREADSKLNGDDPSYATLLAQLALDCESEPDFRNATRT